LGRRHIEESKSLKRRLRIPERVATDLLYEADRTCCICQSPHRTVQLHHIDGNPNNNNPRNLAVLCLDHHDEATRRVGIGRQLTPGLIRRYMDTWLRKVQSRHSSKARAGTRSITKCSHETILDALASHEIRKASSNFMRTTWDKTLRLLTTLEPFTDFRYGNESRMEILDALSCLADRTKSGMTYEVANRIVQLANSILPIFTLKGPAHKRTKEKDIVLFRQAVDIGSKIAYEATKYLRDLHIAAAGAEMLWTVLRFANVNKLNDLKKEAINEFRSLENIADKIGFDDGKRWFEFERLDAMGLNKGHSSRFPSDVAAKLLQRRGYR